MPAVSMTHPVSPATAAPSPSPKLIKAAEQFEALLINTLLGPMEKSFSSLPGRKDVPGDSCYASMATQALASALAGSGGLGIAHMIIRNVMSHQVVTGEPAAKVSAPAADKLIESAATKAGSES